MEQAVFFKSMNTEVVKLVGKSSALLLTQIFQWTISAKQDVIFRTNFQLVEDLCGLLSVATIQRCKNKLVKAGLIELSFKKSYDRVTHYKLTEKALSLFSMVKKKSSPKEQQNVSQEALSAYSDAVSIEDDKSPTDNSKIAVSSANELETTKKQQWIPKNQYREYKQQQHKQQLLNKEMIVSKDMRECFDEGMVGNKKSIPLPFENLHPVLKKMLKRKGEG